MLPVSTQDVIRFSPLKDAAEQAAKAVEAANTELEEAQAAAAAAPAGDDRDSAIDQRVSDAQAALETAQRMAEQAQAAAEAAKPEPVYLLRPTDYRSRVLFERDVRADNAFGLTFGQLFLAVKNAVEDGYVEAPAGLLDEVQAEINDGHTRANFGEMLGRSWDTLWQTAVISEAPSVAQFVADSYARGMLRNYHAIRYVLRGVEDLTGRDGKPVAFRRAAGVVAESTMGAIPEAHFGALGQKALSLIYLPENTRKN